MMPILPAAVMTPTRRTIGYKCEGWEPDWSALADLSKRSSLAKHGQAFRRAGLLPPDVLKPPLPPHPGKALFRSDKGWEITRWQQNRFAIVAQAKKGVGHALGLLKTKHKITPEDKLMGKIAIAKAGIAWRQMLSANATTI